MAPFELSRMKKLLGITKEKFDDFNELMQFMSSALEITMPDSVFSMLHFTSIEENVMHWKWEHAQCFAYKKMNQIGTIAGYRCGVLYRIECWLQVLGVEYSLHPAVDKCIMHSKGQCEGDIRVVLTS
jgi:hypothetical protein